MQLRLLNTSVLNGYSPKCRQTARPAAIRPSHRCTVAPARRDPIREQPLKNGWHSLRVEDSVNLYLLLLGEATVANTSRGFFTGLLRDPSQPYGYAYVDDPFGFVDPTHPLATTTAQKAFLATATAAALGVAAHLRSRIPRIRVTETEALPYKVQYRADGSISRIDAVSAAAAQEAERRYGDLVDSRTLIIHPGHKSDLLMPPKNLPRPGNANKGKAQVSKPKPPAPQRAKQQNVVVRAPVAVAYTQRNAANMSAAMNSDRMVISRREYVQDVIGSVTYDVKSSIPISPVSFPWASAYSHLYESYVFRKCVFEYVPTVSTSEPGSIILAPDFDPTDAHTAAQGKQDLLNMQSSETGQAWAPLVCVCRPADLQKQKSFFNGVAEANNASARQHYAGKLHIAAVGNNSATAPIGELWVNYVIEFMTPQLVPFKGMFQEGAEAASYAGTSNAAPFGTEAAAGSIPATFASTGTTTSVTTWTFRQAWSGYCYASCAGVGVDISIGGTGAEASIGSVEGSTTSESRFAWVDVDQGETFTLTIANTSVSSALAYFMRSIDVRP